MLCENPTFMPIINLFLINIVYNTRQSAHLVFIKGLFMYSDLYPQLKTKYNFDNFEIVLEVLDKQFSDLFKNGFNYFYFSRMTSIEIVVTYSFLISNFKVRYLSYIVNLY